MQSYGLGERNDFRDVGELSKVDLTNSKLRRCRHLVPKVVASRRTQAMGRDRTKKLENVFLKMIVLITPLIGMCV